MASVNVALEHVEQCWCYKTYTEGQGSCMDFDNYEKCLKLIVVPVLCKLETGLFVLVYKNVHCKDCY